MSRYTAFWQSPSNIALIKYWGKKHNVSEPQLPANASLSFTLNTCVSKTKLHYTEYAERSVKLSLDGEIKTAFIPKVEIFMQRIEKYFPFVKRGKFEISTENSFPHSSGIASSASGMSALALCICEIAQQMGLLAPEKFWEMASTLARLGSGSASRSIYGPMALWGEHPDLEESSDQYAIPMQKIHPVFTDYCDIVLLVDQGQKAVSSSFGHDLIREHPFAAQRFNIAQNNVSNMMKVLQSGNLEEFIRLTEQEALMLHALMMSSEPNFILMKPATLAIIEKIREIRSDRSYPWTFTLDAGANVHFLFPKRDEDRALQFVENELKQYCQEETYICDQIGKGPINLRQDD